MPLSHSRGFSLLLAELMIGTSAKAATAKYLPSFQFPISGVNDWNDLTKHSDEAMLVCFSLLLAELMIGTLQGPIP